MKAQSLPKSVTVKGKVIDSLTGKPLSYVTVALQDKMTTNILKSILTREDGSFSFKITSAKQFQLVLVFVGYKNKTALVRDTGVMRDVVS